MVDRELTFLSVEDVLLLHADTIKHEGGLAGVRDVGLLEAAVAMPRQRYAGDYLHADLPTMAAAYLYHLACNHPFNDGNKRVAALACLVFLDTNGITGLPAPKSLEQVIMNVASGSLSKTQTIDWLRGELKK